MKDCGAYYKITKIWFIVADIIILGILSVLCVIAFRSNEGFATALLLSSIFVLFIFVLEFFLLRYYRNIVIQSDLLMNALLSEPIKPNTPCQRSILRLLRKKHQTLSLIFFIMTVRRRKNLFIL